ncbi:MAG TPA: OmpH family outer membrane protein [Acidobacteriota bacterium]|nr:OmpH family outer membrane protein [Acidobacteriota bacterium]
MSRLNNSLLFGVMLMPLCGLAQNPPAAQQPAASALPAVIGPAKVAWLNLEYAIFNCEEGKQEFGKVQQFVEQKNSQLEAMRKESETLKNQLQVQGQKLTDEARTDLEDQIESKDTALQRFQQDTQKEIDARRVKATNYIGRKMLPVIEKIAKEKGLNAVVYLNNQRDAWVDPGLMITEEVIKGYNTTYPVSATKAPAAPAPAPAKKP